MTKYERLLSTGIILTSIILSKKASLKECHGTFYENI